jgi:LysR family transcriptional regulator for bpeEF and oprC
MLVSERTSNLIEEGIDLAIRNGTLTDSTLVARKLGESPIVAVASEEYLKRRGVPSRPDELKKHDGVIFVSQDGPRDWTFRSRTRQVSYRPEGIFRTNDGEQLRGAVLEGLGITQAPHWLFASDIAAGRVQRIMKAYEPGFVTLSAVRPSGRRRG